MLFEQHEAPGVYLAIPAVLSLYATGKTTGLVLDSGAAITSCMPICDGYVVNSAVQTMPFGGRDISRCLGARLGVAAGFGPKPDRIPEELKKRFCFCGPPPAAGAAGGLPATAESFRLPDGQVISVGGEGGAAVSD